MSNERITKEMDLMLAGRDPHKAVQILYELNILRSSLKFPNACKELSENAPSKEMKMFQSVKLVQSMWFLHELFRKDPLVLGVPLALPEKADLFYLALILPFAEYKYEQKGRTHDVYEYIINTGLKVRFITHYRKHTLLLDSRRAATRIYPDCTLPSKTHSAQ